MKARVQTVLGLLVLWSAGVCGVVMEVAVADASRPVYVRAFGMRAGGTVASRVESGVPANVTLCTAAEFRALFLAHTYRESAVADRVTRTMLLARCANTVPAGTVAHMPHRELWHVFVSTNSTTTPTTPTTPASASDPVKVQVTLWDVDGSHLGVGEAPRPRVHAGLAALWGVTLGVYGVSVVAARRTSAQARAQSWQCIALFAGTALARLGAGVYGALYWGDLARTGEATEVLRAAAAVLAGVGDAGVLAAAALLARGAFVGAAQAACGTRDVLLAAAVAALRALAALDGYAGLALYAAVALDATLLPRVVAASAVPVRFYRAALHVYRRARLAPQVPRARCRAARAVRAVCALNAAAAPAALLVAALLPWHARYAAPLVRDLAAWVVLVPLAVLAHPALFRPLSVLQAFLEARRAGAVSASGAASASGASSSSADAMDASAPPPFAVLLPGNRVAVAWEKKSSKSSPPPLPAE